MEESSFESRLAAAVVQKLGVEPDSLVFQSVPSGKYNTTWRLQTGQCALAVRVAPPDRREINLFYEWRMMRQEPGLHRLLRERTRMPAPEILHWDFSHSLLERDFVIMRWCEGTPVAACPGLRSSAWARTLGELGERLAEVHGLRESRYGYLGEHAPMPPQGDWNAAFTVMWNLLLDDILGCGGYSRAEADAMRRLLERRLDCFTRREPPSLLHMDIWAQNILIRPEGALACLLDWDRALWGDPEIEFAVLDFCGISEPAFWEGYGRRRENDQAARVRLGFYLLYEIQKYIFIRRVRGGNPTLADSYRLQSLELAARLGLEL